MSTVRNPFTEISRRGRYVREENEDWARDVMGGGWLATMIRDKCISAIGLFYFFLHSSSFDSNVIALENRIKKERMRDGNKPTHVR